MSGEGVGGDLHQRGDHVHARLPGKFEFLPVRLGFGIGLSLNFEEYGLFSRHECRF